METCNEATPPKTEQTFNLFLTGYALPLYGWMGLSSWALTHWLPWWAAVPLGLPLGCVLWMVTGRLIGDGSTLVELTVGSTIGLVLALILMPIFSQARDQARVGKCRESLKTSVVLLRDDFWLMPDYLPLYAEPDGYHRLGKERGHHVLYASGRVVFVRDAAPAKPEVRLALGR